MGEQQEEQPGGLARLLEEDPADLYENAPCGYLSMVPDGRVVKVNGTFCAWTGRSPEGVLGRRLPDLLSAGGRVYYETHLAPLLRLQGGVREVALDVVRDDGSVLPCLVNAVEVRDDEGRPVLVRATVFEATSRRRYEDRKSTRLNSSHANISYAVFCLKKKKKYADTRVELLSYQPNQIPDYDSSFVRMIHSDVAIYSHESTSDYHQ